MAGARIRAYIDKIVAPTPAELGMAAVFFPKIEMYLDRVFKSEEYCFKPGESPAEYHRRIISKHGIFTWLYADYKRAKEKVGAPVGRVTTEAGQEEYYADLIHMFGWIQKNFPLSPRGQPLLDVSGKPKLLPLNVALALDAIHKHGNDFLKKLFTPKMQLIIAHSIADFMKRAVVTPALVTSPPATMHGVLTQRAAAAATGHPSSHMSTVGLGFKL